MESIKSRAPEPKVADSRYRLNRGKSFIKHHLVVSCLVNAERKLFFVCVGVGGGYFAVVLHYVISDVKFSPKQQQRKVYLVQLGLHFTF